MSLYYNDEFWFFDKLNKKKPDPNFVLIRKLIVSNVPNELFSVEQLTKKFRKYGEIKNIEMKTDEHFVAESATDFSNYAYITFKETADAHKALKEKERRGRPFMVQPANTWKQPVDQFEPTGIDYFGQLDDYCLMELFDHISMDDLITLAEVSLRLNLLLHDKVFQRVKQIKINCDNTSMTITKLRRTLLAHGKYVSSVIFILPQSKDQKVVDRMVDLFTKHIGDKLVRLEIRGLTPFKRNLSQFKRIFQHLKVLKWRGWERIYEDNSTYERFPESYFDDDIDLLNICTNLEKLTITQPHGFIKNSGAWPKLKNVHIGFELWEEEPFTEFFKNNPQITSLKMRGEYSDVLLNEVVTHLPNLEKLKIYDAYDNIEPEQTQLMIAFQKLRVLKIQYINPDKMNFLLDIIGLLPELEEIELKMIKLSDGETVPHLTSLKTFAENSRKAKRFRIGYYKLTDDVVVDMIRYNQCLEVFDICNCEVKLTQQLLMNMCDAHEHSTRADTGPIEIVVDTFEDNEIDKYLMRKHVTKHIKLVKKTKELNF